MDEDWDELMSDGSEAEDSVDRDPDWVQTPRVPQRRSGRRTNSIETTSLSMIKSSGVCGKCCCFQGADPWYIRRFLLPSWAPDSFS